MLDVVAYICNYTYKFLDATLFMLDVQALAYSDTYQNYTVYVYKYLSADCFFFQQCQCLPEDDDKNKFEYETNNKIKA